MLPSVLIGSLQPQTPLAVALTHLPNTWLAFGPGTSLNLRDASDVREAIGHHRPGWRADVVIVDLCSRDWPSGLFDLGVPVIGLALDWRYNWSLVRVLGRCCDWLLSDPVGAEALRQDGLAHVDAITHPTISLPRTLPNDNLTERKSSLLAVGRLHPSDHPTGLDWVLPVARLSHKHSVRIVPPGPQLTPLLEQSSVALMLGWPGEWDSWASLAVSLGVVPVTPTPAPGLAPDWVIACPPGQALEVCESLLQDESPRQTALNQCRERSAGMSWAEMLVHWVETNLSKIPRDTRAGREAPSPAQQTIHLLARAVHLHAGGPTDPGLLVEMHVGVNASPAPETLCNWLGMLTGEPSQALEWFDRALQHRPHSARTSLNRAEALLALREDAAARQEAERLVDGLITGQVVADVLAPPALVGGGDLLAWWNRALWQAAGLPSLAERECARLVRARAELLLAVLTGDLTHHHEAALTAPVQPSLRASLGCALARAGKLGRALAHLRDAVASDPLDRPAARALDQALSDSGLLGERSEYRKLQALLHKVLPDLVPHEAWMGDAYNWLVRWEGDLESAHSLSLVNRQLVGRLLARGTTLEWVSQNPTNPAERLPLPDFIQQARGPSSHTPSVVVRHAWPANLNPPRSRPLGVGATLGVWLTSTRLGADHHKQCGRSVGIHQPCPRLIYPVGCAR